MRYNNRNNKFLGASGARLIVPLPLIGLTPYYYSYGVEIDSGTEFASFTGQILNSAFSLSDLYIIYSAQVNKAAMDIELVIKTASIGADRDTNTDTYDDHELGAVVIDILVKESILSLVTTYSPEDMCMVRVKGKTTVDHETDLLVHGVFAEYTQ